MSPLSTHLHSLFLSMAAWRGVASTIALGGDSRKSITPFETFARCMIEREGDSGEFPATTKKKQPHINYDSPHCIALNDLLLSTRTFSHFINHIDQWVLRMHKLAKTLRYCTIIGVKPGRESQTQCTN